MKNETADRATEQQERGQWGSSTGATWKRLRQMITDDYNDHDVDKDADDDDDVHAQQEQQEEQHRSNVECRRPCR